MHSRGRVLQTITPTRKSSFFLKFSVVNLGCTVMFASKETLYPEQKLDETV